MARQTRRILGILAAHSEAWLAARRDHDNRRHYGENPGGKADANPLDPAISFKVPADGEYVVLIFRIVFVRVADRTSRIGQSRRLPSADFRLWLGSDAVTLPRKGTARLKIAAERIGGFQTDRAGSAGFACPRFGRKDDAECESDQRRIDVQNRRTAEDRCRAGED